VIDLATDIRRAIEERRRGLDLKQAWRDLERARLATATVGNPHGPGRQRGFIMTPYAFATAATDGPLGLTVTNSSTTLNSTGVTPKFGATGCCFVGSTQSSGSKFVSIAHNAGFTAAADFTIEMWIQVTNNATFQVFCYKAAGTGQSPWELWLSSGGKLSLFCSKSDGTALVNIAGTTTVTTNAWHFIQARRTGNVFACALDGTQEATVTVAGALWSDGDAVTVGNFASGSAANMLGYWQDFRFTNGVSRAFAVPTAVFPNS
jgi:hypothetical protein